MPSDVYEEDEEMMDGDSDSKNEPGESEGGSVAELQIINKVLDSGSYDIIRKNGIDSSYFPGYQSEFDFIQEHYSKYQVVPDITTFLEKFPEFDLMEIYEAELAIITNLKEEKAYSMIAPTLNEINKAAAKDAIEAAQLMKDKADAILKEVNIIKYKPGYDLFINAYERAQLYADRIGLDGVLGCMSNIPKLDQATHGWMDTDFLAITARPQEGKSWIGEYLALMPWLHQKKKIAFFSLENSKDILGYRADTLLQHFSNDALMSGKEVLAWHEGRPKLTKEDYLDYVEAAKSYGTPFSVYDNYDNTNGIWTIEEIEEAATQADFIIIDQLSLLGISKRVKTIREGYVHTTRYIRQMVNKVHKPVCLLCQSGRESAKMNQKDKEASPELHQIAESDSVGQDATKVLSLKNMDGFLKLSLKKNTSGRSNIDCILRWDIDQGLLEPISLDEGDPNPERNF